MRNPQPIRDLDLSGLEPVVASSAADFVKRIRKGQPWQAMGGRARKRQDAVIVINLPSWHRLMCRTDIDPATDPYSAATCVPIEVLTHEQYNRYAHRDYEVTTPKVKRTAASPPEPTAPLARDGQLRALTAAEVAKEYGVLIEAPRAWLASERVNERGGKIVVDGRLMKCLDGYTPPEAPVEEVWLTYAEASEKYKVPTSVIAVWTQRGHVGFMRGQRGATGSAKVLDDARLAERARAYEPRPTTPSTASVPEAETPEPEAPTLALNGAAEPLAEAFAMRQEAVALYKEADATREQIATLQAEAAAKREEAASLWARAEEAEREILLPLLPTS